MYPGFAPHTGFRRDAFGAAQLTARMISRFGSSLIWLAVAEDVVPVSGLANDLPARVGPTGVYGANAVGKYSIGTTDRGIKCLYSPETVLTNKQKTIKITTSVAPKSLWGIANSGSSSPTEYGYYGYLNMIVPAAVNQGLVRSSSIDQQWLTPTDWTRYKNGISNSVADLGVLSVYSCDNSSNSANGIGLLGYYNDYTNRTCWPWPLVGGMALSRVPTEQERLDSVADWKRYARIT